MDEGDVARREEEEQLVIEATIRQRASQLTGESPGPASPSGGGGADDTASEGSFGSSLANYNRSRTFSNNSNVSDNQGADGAPRTPIRHTDSADSDSSALLSLAMSPDDRRALESEMRAQLSHETHRRVESEAEEARMRHAEEWYGSQAGARARMREARLAELTGMLERMSTRSGGGSNIDNRNREAGSSLMAGGGERVGLAGAGGPSLSRLLRAMENSSAGGGRGASLEDLMRLEAAFFLGMGGEGARSRRSRRARDDDSDDDEGGAEGLRMDPFGLGPRPVRSSASSRRSAARRSGRSVSSTHLDTAELLMRGVSEEEQLAMAIAMSMQDTQEQNNEGGGVCAETGEGAAPSFNQVAGRDESPSSSSSDTSGAAEGEETQNSAGTRNDQSRSAEHPGAVDVDEVSLDDDEEEVVFAEV